MRRTPAWLLELRRRFTRLSLRVSFLLVQVRLVPGFAEGLDGSAAGSHVGACRQLVFKSVRPQRRQEVQADVSRLDIGMEPSVLEREEARQEFCAALIPPENI